MGKRNELAYKVLIVIFSFQFIGNTAFSQSNITNLGQGWSGNTVIFRHHGIVTYGNY